MFKALNKYLPNSIKQRTLILVMSLFTLTSLLLGVVSVGFANHEVEELFDARLAQQARLLLKLAGEDLSEGRKVPTFVYPSVVTESDEYELSAVGHEYESKIYFRIWRNDKVVASSDSQSIEPEQTHYNGFGSAKSERYEWRTFELTKTLEKDNQFRIVVAERLDVRGEIVTEIVLNTVLPQLIGWPLIGLLVWGAVGIGLEPLKQLTNRIQKIEPAQLEPVNLQNVPQELAPIQQALNTLLSEIDDLMAREKRWIADAAHELRTPLAILKLHAQNAESSQNEQERQHSLLKMVDGVDRSARIVEQLLAYARVESQSQGTCSKEIALQKETRQILAELYPIVAEKDIVLEVRDSEKELMFPIEVNHLEIILRNLVSNAVKFTPVGGRIDIGWYRFQDSVTLDVSDTGEGVSRENLTRLTERFFRGSDHSGAGLGLSIVAALTKQYDATINFEPNRPNGLTVRVSFPP
ncbi:two-component sensor histidine kinase [Marinomonas piezotolerans]|uniref:histidine kinase n=1 Tax=Marinomonas piezotolerans TaxID=2213058 RepID=A0A370UEB0_9GAMM|nr:ATP-binding protein [Marinomonas piezotolerans]RDL46104.1 two-component sensor histidine kinase [Marinomonas piezotolerans]